MSTQFDEFGEQLREVLIYIKELKSDNVILKKYNILLNNEVNLLG